MNRFAVIGHPVAHSLSPAMHAANFKALAFDGEYGKYDVAAEDLKSFVLKKRDEGYLGLNVTIPHKRDIIELLDRVDPLVADTGSCNTLKFDDDGTIAGYNTDVEGFLYSLSNVDFALKGKKVLLVGCGGAGQSIALVCAKKGVSGMALASRSDASVESLCEKIVASGFCGEIQKLPADTNSSLEFRSVQWRRACRECDLIVNASPVGLNADDTSILSRDCFSGKHVFLDIIPVRRRTPSVDCALSAGAVTIDGLEFLVAQGAKSFEIWTGLEADRKAMLKAVGKGNS